MGTEISSVTLFLFFLILFYLFFFISFLKVENGFYSSKPRRLGDPSSRDLQVNELLGRKILQFSFRRFFGCSELKSRVQGTTLAGGNTLFGVHDPPSHDGQMRGEALCIINRRACCEEAVLRRDGVRARCRSPFPRRLALFRRKTRRSLRAVQRESGDEKRRQIAVPIGADHAQDVAHDATTGKEESPQ